jgi:hypothetical protein
MSVKDAAAKKRREIRKDKKEMKKDPLAASKVETSFDNALMNLSGDVLLRHFVNKHNHDIYVIFERRLNLKDAEIRSSFVSAEAEAQTKSGVVTCIKVSVKKKVIEQALMKEAELHKIVVARYLKERNRKF